MLPKCSFGPLSFLAAIAVCFGLVAAPAFAQQETGTSEEVAKPSERKAEDEKADKELTPELLGRLDGQEGENPLFKLVDEVTAGMKQIEDLLNQRNTSPDTQALQGKTINKLEELIKEMEKQ